MKPTRLVPAVAAVAALTLSACSFEPSADADAGPVVVGYQSKTINTVTAGTLLRAQGFLEQRLAEIGEETGTAYRVEWQDYDTGAPITAQMVAEKIDIGSMGDYPLLINGSRTQDNPRARTQLVSVTGYNPEGALNMVVVPPDSPATTLADLAGAKVSASVGSAGHGTLVQALDRAGIDPATGVEVLNQQPQVGASALESGQVAALSQFVAWPGLLVHQDKATLLYDGAELGVPTLHGVVVRSAYADEHPEVLDAFLRAQLDATRYLVDDPLDAARIVADASGLPQEVVYLYNGPGGTTFETALEPHLVEALKGNVPYLESIGDFAELDVDGFVSDTALQAAFAAEGLDYDAAVADTSNPSVLRGTDPVCERAVDDVALAGEIWFAAGDATQVAADPTCLLRAVQQARADGRDIRGVYVPDTELGTRWFADKSVWVVDGDRYLPFTTEAAATRYLSAHPGSVPIEYERAVEEVRP